MIDRAIKSVTGLPDADNDFAVYSVGQRGVTDILPREQNLGTYGILWIDVYKNNEAKPSDSINALTGVTEIGYKD